MKKIIACIIIAVFMATALCGCGNYGDARDDGAYSSVDTPAATSMITPDMDEDDGIVNDRDGIIENSDNAGSTGTSGSAGSTGSTDASGSTGSTGTSGTSGSAGTSAGNGGTATSPKVTDKP